MSVAVAGAVAKPRKRKPTAPASLPPLEPPSDEDPYDQDDPAEVADARRITAQYPPVDTPADKRQRVLTMDDALGADPGASLDDLAQFIADDNAEQLRLAAERQKRGRPSPPFWEKDLSGELIGVKWDPTEPARPKMHVQLRISEKVANSLRMACKDAAVDDPPPIQLVKGCHVIKLTCAKPLKDAIAATPELLAVYEKRLIKKKVHGTVQLIPWKMESGNHGVYANLTEHLRPLAVSKA